MISDLLHTGPRLLLGFWFLIREAIHLRRTKIDDCAKVLALVAEKDNASTWEELGTMLSDLDWPQINQQLIHIRGVVYLEKGITMTPALREEIRGVVAGNS